VGPKAGLDEYRKFPPLPPPGNLIPGSFIEILIIMSVFALSTTAVCNKLIYVPLGLSVLHWYLFLNVCFVCFWLEGPHWVRTSSFLRFLDHTQRLTTVGRTPLGE